MTLAHRANANDKTDLSGNGLNSGNVDTNQNVANTNKWSANSGHNPNLDIGLLDVEPEANLFLDEASIAFSPKYSQDSKTSQAISKINDSLNSDSVIDTR